VYLGKLDQAELTRQCGEEVPEILIIVAKHAVLDMDSKTIGELIGVSTEEIESLQDDPLYKNVHLLLKAATSGARVNAELGWDSLEEIAISRLLERVPLERDADFLLKVAAMANRATRRTKPEALDPGKVGTRVPLTLTARVVRRLHGDGSQEEASEVTISGSHTNPTFADVDGLLSVSQKPFMDKPMQIATHSTADPTADELYAGFDNDGSWDQPA